jgi:myo-inositol-1(or 4)-monophosphatase
MTVRTPEGALKDYLEFAVQVCRGAGKIIVDGFRKPVEIEYKGEIDLVTATDKASERYVTGLISKEFPEHSILAEEGGETKGSDHRWILDPLDGTTNFAHKYPCFAVSLGLEIANQMVLGVVYDPIREELFSASKGGGTTLNGAPIAVSEVSELSKSLLATGFPYDRQEKIRQVAHFKSFIGASQAVRRDGSAALDLCYVACGRFDGFWEHSLRPWDTAAGVVVVKEAGGVVTDFKGGDFRPELSEITVSNGVIHGAMLELLGKGQA